MNQEKVTQETNEEVKEVMNEEVKVKREEFEEEAAKDTAVDLEEERRKHAHKLTEIVELDDRIREICPDIDNILYKNIHNAIEGTVLKDKKMVKKGIGFLRALEEINVIAKGATKAFKKGIKENVKTGEPVVKVIVGPGKTEQEYKKLVEEQIRKQLAGKLPQEVIDDAVIKATEEGWEEYKKRNFNK